MVNTERKRHGRDKKKGGDLKRTAGHSAWWNPILGTHFPLWRNGRALGKQRRDKDHQGAIRALEYT